MSIPEHFVLTPHGLVHENCIGDPVDDGHCPRLKSAKDLIARTPGGWIESATYTPPEPLGSLTTSFTVPGPPTNSSGSVIFLFPGAQNGRLSTILQPVLQWGYNGCFGGEFWSIACWWCTPSGHTYYSENSRVEPGERLHASLSAVNVGTESADWNLEIGPDGDDTRKVSCTATGVEELMLFVAGGALEVYWVVEAEEAVPVLTHERTLYPAETTTFSEIRLTDLNGRPIFADWVRRWPQEEGLGGENGFGVDVSSDSVTLRF